MRGSLEIQAVLLLLLHSCGRVPEALQMLQDLLARARAEGYVRLFLDEGETMLTLLRVSLPHLHERALTAYVQRILRAATASQSEPTSSPAPAYTLLAEPLDEARQRLRIAPPVLYHGLEENRAERGTTLSWG